MLLAGQTVLRDRLGPLAYLLFWATCMTFTLLAVLAAFWEALSVHRRTRIEQRELLKDALAMIDRSRSDPPNPERSN
jgi:hypothetical protein